MSAGGLTLRPPEPPPPPERVTPWGWARRNLFGSPTSALITVLLVLVLGWMAVVTGTWALTTARWGVVVENLRLFLIGLYPPAEAWRPWLALVLVSLMAGLSSGTWGGPLRTAATWLAALVLGLLSLWLYADSDYSINIVRLAREILSPDQYHRAWAGIGTRAWILFLIATVALLVIVYIFRREMLESFTELIFLPFYRFKLLGPGVGHFLTEVVDLEPRRLYLAHFAGAHFGAGPGQPGSARARRAGRIGSAGLGGLLLCGGGTGLRRCPTDGRTSGARLLGGGRGSG